jgi:hypothetical protein
MLLPSKIGIVKMEFEGEPSKPWAVWRLYAEGKQIEKVAEADTREELDGKYQRRLDWRYGIFYKRERVASAP